MADSRLRDSGGPDRQSRSMESREVTSDRTEAADKLRQFVEQLESNALPDIPPIKGFHVCWLSQTNAYDTIAKRVRLGYVPVKPEEVPGWEVLSTTNTSQTPGTITWNEMVAYKLPMDIYQAAMTHFHHTKPNQDEEAIYAALEQAMSHKGKSLIKDVGDGIRDLQHNNEVRPPVFQG